MCPCVNHAVSAGEVVRAARADWPQRLVQLAVEGRPRRGLDAAQVLWHFAQRRRGFLAGLDETDLSTRSNTHSDRITIYYVGLLSITYDYSAEPRFYTQLYLAAFVFTFKPGTPTLLHIQFMRLEFSRSFRFNSKQMSHVASKRRPRSPHSLIISFNLRSTL